MTAETDGAAWVGLLKASEQDRQAAMAEEYGKLAALSAEARIPAFAA